MTNDEILNCTIEGLEYRIIELQQILDRLRTQRLEQKRSSDTHAAPPKTAEPKKRQMTPAGRARIAAATKARWAAFRAAKEAAPTGRRKKGKVA